MSEALSEQVYEIGGKWLRIEGQKVEWENSLLTSSVEQPNEMRFGVAPIRLEHWAIGTKFMIELRRDGGKALQIPIKYYFGIGRTKKVALYRELVDLFIDNYMDDAWSLSLHRWESGETLYVGKFVVDAKGVCKQYGTHKTFIAFEEMQVVERMGHLLINCKNDPKRYMKLEFLKDWNWPLVELALMKKMIWKPSH